MKNPQTAGAISDSSVKPGQTQDPALPVRKDLLATEAKLSQLLDSNKALIGEICHYLVDAGGKRLRPLFILLVYRACGGVTAKVEDAIDAAIALEFILIPRPSFTTTSSTADCCAAANRPPSPATVSRPRWSPVIFSSAAPSSCAAVSRNDSCGPPRRPASSSPRAR